MQSQHNCYTHTMNSFNQETEILVLNSNLQLDSCQNNFNTHLHNRATNSLAFTVCIFIRSHMKCGTYICLIGLKLPPTPDPKCVLESYSEPGALNFTEILMIYCRHIYWVVSKYSVKVGPNCSRFRKMTAILNRKKYIFPLFSQSIYIIGYSNEIWY